LAAAGRIPPQDRADWSTEIRPLLDATVAKTKTLEAESHHDLPVAILRVLANHPRCMEPFLGWANFVAFSDLSRRHQELLALRTVWLRQSEFEYGHHVEYARRAGLSDEELAWVVVGPSAAGWDDTDRALLTAADELFADTQISDATWAALAARFTTNELIEIPIIVGQYSMLSMIANGLGVVLEDGYEPLPARSGPA
jgi:4-carboxymuconolactone decarboxylase